MYKKIEEQIPVVNQYEEKLIEEGIVTREECVVSQCASSEREQVIC